MDQRRLLLGVALLGGGALLRALRRPAPVDLRDKVVIVTGASSGIGLAAARAFAAEGARLVLAARRAEKLHEAAGELARAHGRPPLVVPTDVTDEAGRRALIDAAVETFGRIDVLVNNAGVTWIGAFYTHDPDDLQQMLQVNVYAYLRLAQLVLPVMLRQGSGYIVNIGSIAGRCPVPGMVGYVASRAAIHGFTYALRRELAGTGVHVSLVMPTWTRTPIAGEHEFAMVESVGLPVDDVQIPAAAAVDAVRRRRRSVTLGGMSMAACLACEALAPQVVDWVVRAVLRLRPDFTEMLFGAAYEKDTA
ncbi:MAG: SDR family NAD(P)-dependent oxidoreductase [Anaerolineae bacterium]|nr:SDR family NAD(P)-dependent oxidoreductase [Anaerolineae bacterium]